MNGSLWLFLEILLNFFDIAFMFLIMTHQLGRRENTQKKYILIFYLISVFAFTLYNHITFHGASAAFAMIVIFMTYSVIFLQGSLLHKFFWLFIPLSLMLCSDLFAMYVVTQKHPGISNEIFIAPNIYRLQAAIITKSIEVFILILFLKIKLNLITISKRNVIITTAFVSIIFLSMISAYILLSYDYKDKATMFLNITIIFLIAMFVFAYILLSQNKQFDERQQKALNEQSEMYQASLIEKEKIYQKSLQEHLKMQQTELKLLVYEEIKASHDKFYEYQAKVNELLQNIWGLAKREKLSELDRLMCYFSKINVAFNSLQTTGNELVDMVLMGKGAIANQDSIFIETEIELPAKNRVESIDLNVILINLLDNAIQAMKRDFIDELYRTIELTIKSIENNLVITAKNITGTGAQSDEEIEKLQSPSRPGFGLKIINELVKKYHGSLEITHMDFYFTVTIKFPLLKE